MELILFGRAMNCRGVSTTPASLYRQAGKYKIEKGRGWWRGKSEETDKERRTTRSCVSIRRCSAGSAHTTHVIRTKQDCSATHSVICVTYLLYRTRNIPVIMNYIYGIRYMSDFSINKHYSDGRGGREERERDRGDNMGDRRGERRECVRACGWVWLGG